MEWTWEGIPSSTIKVSTVFSRPTEHNHNIGVSEGFPLFMNYYELLNLDLLDLDLHLNLIELDLPLLVKSTQQ